MNVNKVMLCGRLGQDPEIKYVGKDNTAVCNLSIATNDGWGDREETNWHRVTVWGDQAENVAKYLKAGAMIFIEGRIQYRKVDDKEGTKYYTDIRADRVQFGPKSSGNDDKESRRQRTMDNADEGTKRAADKARRGGGKNGKGGGKGKRGEDDIPF